MLLTLRTTNTDCFARITLHGPSTSSLRKLDDSCASSSMLSSGDRRGVDGNDGIFCLRFISVQVSDNLHSTSADSNLWHSSNNFFSFLLLFLAHIRTEDFGTL